MATRTNYVLVDFENVQPQDIGLLKSGPFKVKVFLGPNQVKIPVSLAVALQSLGDNVEYISLETAGNNALDFLIAYYIGVLSAADPTAFFHIISKDTGFDPLLRYLKGKKIFSQRSTCIADIPYFKPEAQIKAALPAPAVQIKAALPAPEAQIKAAAPAPEAQIKAALPAPEAQIKAAAPAPAVQIKTVAPAPEAQIKATPPAPKAQTKTTPPAPKAQTKTTPPAPEAQIKSKRSESREELISGCRAGG